MCASFSACWPGQGLVAKSIQLMSRPVATRSGFHYVFQGSRVRLSEMESCRVTQGRRGAILRPDFRPNPRTQSSGRTVRTEPSGPELSGPELFQGPVFGHGSLAGGSPRAARHAPKPGGLESPRFDPPISKPTQDRAAARSRAGFGGTFPLSSVRVQVRSTRRWRSSPNDLCPWISLCLSTSSRHHDRDPA